ncbi:hypothetical protein DSUL_50455 [Desulfovibrionales bacterium]
MLTPIMQQMDSCFDQQYITAIQLNILYLNASEQLKKYTVHKLNVTDPPSLIANLNIKYIKFW